MTKLPGVETASPRSATPRPLTPLSVVLVALVLAVVGGGSLLLSAAESATLVDGAIEWGVTSPLRAVVQVLCLNYQFPTINAGEVKNLILGIGAGVAALAVAIGVLARARSEDEERQLTQGEASGGPGDAGTASRHDQITALLAAQLLTVLYVLWAAVSSRWSVAPDMALGGAVLLGIQLLWAFGLGIGLDRRSAAIAARLLIAVGAISAVVAVWYYYGRNPNLRAKFPYGNPTFLAASLLPAIVLAAAQVVESIGALRRNRSAVSALLLAGASVAAGLMLWALILANSRGATLGLAVALLALVPLSLRRWPRWASGGGLLFLLIVAGVYFFSQTQAESRTGRSASIRLREYAWSYAWRMFEDRPLAGHGMGGYVLKGDSFVPQDVLADPEPFQGRLTHAHNEWLEVLADLGAIGAVLLVGLLVLTFRAGIEAADRERPRPWMLIGLTAGLLGLLVDASFGVGLRVSGVPTWFFTVLGLTWALSRQQSFSLAESLSRSRGGRLGLGAAGGLLGILAVMLSQQDFAAARSSFQVDQRLQEGDFESATLLAEAGLTRLSPQRGLTGLFQLARAHTYMARTLQQQALEREERARAGEIPDPQPLALAAEDRQRASLHAAAASRALRELLARSPGYLDHGRIEYELNRVVAEIVAAEGDRAAYEQAIANATMAIERELRRQPFDAALARLYVSAAGERLSLVESLVLLARPLRYALAEAETVQVLGGLATGPDFEDQLRDLLGRAYASLSGDAPAEGVSPPGSGAAGSSAATGTDDPLVIWAPEVFRLVAAYRFLAGSYVEAVQYQEVAARAYAEMSQVPFGAAACWAELADSRFFADPTAAESAIAAGQRAIRLAPLSLNGRELVDAVDRRMITYYLAADDESSARLALRQFAPPNISEEGLAYELGLRYRNLCRSVLGRREAGILRKPASELMSHLKRWIGRALALSPQDAAAHYLAADLAIFEGDADAAAGLLERSLELGLDLRAGLEFLQMATDRQPGSEAMKKLLEEVKAAMEATPDPQPTAPAAPRG